MHADGLRGVSLLPLAERFAVAARIVAVLGGDAAADFVDFRDGVVGGDGCGGRWVHFSASNRWKGVASTGVCRPSRSWR